MDKIIPFNKGIRRQPSLGEDGELSELVNLVPKNGELVNVKGEKRVVGGLKIGDEMWTLLCTHSTDMGKNFIITNGSALKYYRQYSGASGWSPIPTPEDIGGIISATAIGNMVPIVCEDGIQYLYWNNGGYTNLGMNIPHIEASFYTKYKKASNTSYGYLNVNPNDKINSFKTLGATQYLSDLNLLSKHYFISPFFAKCAYELYDGTFLDCSPHVLIACTTKFPLLAKINEISGDYNIQLEYSFYKHRLFVSCPTSKEVRDKILKFKDIIKGVCVFIAPLQLGGSEMHCTWTDNMFSSTNINGYSVDLKKFAYTQLNKYNDSPCCAFVNKNFNEEVTNCSNFYLLKKVALETFLSGNEMPMNGNEDFTNENLGDFEDVDLSYSNIVTMESLPPSQNTVNNVVTARSVFSYNNRLFMGNLKRWFYNGVSPLSFFPYNPYTKYESSRFDSYVVIEKSGKEYVLKLESSEYTKAIFDASQNKGICYFYYPDEGARQLLFPFNENHTLWCVVNLKKHPTLNGSYAYNDMNPLATSSSGEVPSIFDREDDKWYNSTGDVCYTYANNPLVFGDINYVSVGNGDIINISSSAKALSQGQFGQYPLYAFCTDGVWALEIAEDGSIGRVAPISRDVCNNPDSITQIDGAVVFTTDQGLKMIQGSEVVLLSGYMDGYNVKEGDYFPSEYFKNKGFKDFDALVKEESRDFRTILKECRIAYDYPNNMLRIYPKENKGKYYVFDLGTREFSSCIDDTQVETVVADYPSSFVQKGSSVYSFDGSPTNERRNGLLLTRPISLDNPSALKKLQELKLHYSKLNDGTYCKVCLFVSNDGKSWAEKTSLRGGSYKYFRFGVITNMTDDEALSGMVVRYELNRTNKLR